MTYVSPLKGRSKSLEHRKRIGDALRGRKLSKEHRKRLSKVKIGISRIHSKDCNCPWHKPLPFYERWNWIPGVPKKKETVHSHMNSLYGKPNHCENLGCNGKSKHFEWSSKLHDYSTVDLGDWQQLCRSCHIKYDIKFNGRKKNQFD